MSADEMILLAQFIFTCILGILTVLGLAVLTRF